MKHPGQFSDVAIGAWVVFGMSAFGDKAEHDCALIVRGRLGPL